MLINASNEEFLSTSTERVSLLLSDPPWGAGEQNTESEFTYSDEPEDMPGHIDRLTAYNKRCVDTAAIFCDKRSLHLWHAALLRDVSEGNIQHVVLESAIGNYKRTRWPQKHYYMIIAHYREPVYFDFAALPETDRRAPKKGYNGLMRKTNGVVQATMSCTDKERVKGFTAQKPVWFLKDVINVLCPKEGKVVDPYGGTGSTFVACIETGREYHGYEMNPNTYRVACERIEKARQVLGLL